MKYLFNPSSRRVEQAVPWARDIRCERDDIPKHFDSAGG